MTTCTRCRRPMRLLFTSYSCDYCSQKKDSSKYFKGYALWSSKHKSGTADYIFESTEDAIRWKKFKDLYDFYVVEVWSEFDFHFMNSRGSIRDLRIADRLFEIFKDENFEVKPYRAFIAPVK